MRQVHPNLIITSAFFVWIFDFGFISRWKNKEYFFNSIHRRLLNATKSTPGIAFEAFRVLITTIRHYLETQLDLFIPLAVVHNLSITHHGTDNSHIETPEPTINLC